MKKLCAILLLCLLPGCADVKPTTSLQASAKIGPDTTTSKVVEVRGNGNKNTQVDIGAGGAWATAIAVGSVAVVVIVLCVVQQRRYVKLKRSLIPGESLLSLCRQVK